METVIDIILAEGNVALDVSLYILLAIMVVTNIVLRLLDPVIGPFGLHGLGGLAILGSGRTSLVAPLSTLKMTEARALQTDAGWVICRDSRFSACERYHPALQGRSRRVSSPIRRIDCFNVGLQDIRSQVGVERLSFLLHGR